MAEILCQVCGRPNPPEQDLCQFCHAPLKPLPDSPPQYEEGDQTAEPSNLETGLGNQTGEAPNLEPGSEEDDVPEWLKHIRSLHAADELSAPYMEMQAGEWGPPEDEAGEETLGAVPEDTAGDFEGYDAERAQEDSAAHLELNADEGAAENSTALPEVDAGESVAEGPTETDRDQPRSWLPGWLEGLRPVEDAALPPPEEPDAPAQNSGPLAGLGGLLFADEQITRPLKPPALLPKLRVSGAQRAHIDLLVDTLEAEGEAPIDIRPARRRNYSQKISIWLISLVMLGAILWPLTTTGLPTPAPALPEESQEAYRLVEALAPGDPVLVVVDFEPGFTGELEAGAAPVLDHVMLKGATLALVSSSPTGPLLGERFITQTLAQHQFIRNLQYVNLGFIPGGASGLASFSQDPLGTLPVTIDGVVVGAPDLQVLPTPLQGIHRLSDFRLVLVIVDQPLAARAWVEQVQPQLAREGEQTSLLMVVSAQAEPLVRPFYEANPRQVQGLIAGLRGGAAYAEITGRSRLEPAIWDAFGLGTLAAALIILTGGLVGMAVKSLRQPAAQP